MLLPIGILKGVDTATDKSHVPGVYSSTAFMVSPCLALSVHHSIFGPKDGQRSQPRYKTTMHLGVADAGGFRYDVEATPVRWGSGKVDGQDWALFKLQKCTGSRLGWMDLKILHPERMSNIRVAMASFPSDRSPEKITVQLECTIYAFVADGEGVSHDCASRAGASGSPIFVIEDGIPKVVAFHIGSTSDSKGVIRQLNAKNQNLAFAVGMLEYFPEVLTLINEDIRLFNQRGAIRGPST